VPRERPFGEHYSADLLLGGSAPDWSGEGPDFGEQLLRADAIVEATAPMGVAQDAPPIDHEGRGDVNPLIVDDELACNLIDALHPGGGISEDGEAQLQLLPPPGGAERLLGHEREELGARGLEPGSMALQLTDARGSEALPIELARPFGTQGGTRGDALLQS
jgi:hypothetical protein